MSLRTFLVALSALALMAGCETGDETEADRMAQEHEDDTPEATAAAGAPVLSVEASPVDYARTEEGEPLTGYIARPQQADSVLDARGMDPTTEGLPAIVVIHEWWGLNDNIRAATRRLAGEGYRALAVDLYDGDTAETPETAEALMEEAMKEEERLTANVQRARDYLQSEEGAPQVAVLGWCFGGSMTFEALASMPTAFDAAVVYYGSPEDLTEDDVAPIETPILGHFGRQDEAIPIEGVREFASMMEDLGKEFQLYEYDAGHAFANPSGTTYDPEAAERAWSRTTDFLGTHLYPEVAIE